MYLNISVSLTNAEPSIASALIPFLCAKNISFAEVHWGLCLLYEPIVMSEGYVRQWCQGFQNWRVDVHDEGSTGEFPYVRRTCTSIYNIVTERFGRTFMDPYRPSGNDLFSHL